MTDEPHHDIDELAQRVAELEAQQQELAEDQEQVLGLFERFKKGVISRRTFLSSVAAIGGIGLAANAQAAPSWGSASGNSGTSANPLSDVYSQTGTFQTVSTDIINTTPPADGVTKTTEKIVFSPQRYVAEYTQRTTGVSTSTVEILSTEDSDLVRAAFTIVEGTRDGSPGDIFVDLVLFTRSGSASAVSSVETNVSETRTYDVNGSNLTLSFDSGTFGIDAFAIGSRSG